MVELITFTGVDACTDLKELQDLSDQYPIEWGILFSATHLSRRYMTADCVKYVAETVKAPLSAHICGRLARNVLDGHGFVMPRLLEQHFLRAQINVAAGTDIDLGRLHEDARKLGMRAILQFRDDDKFPEVNCVDWLFDASGGRGILPSGWPALLERPWFANHTTRQTCGYAGGLNPDNVAEAVKAMDAVAKRPYAIDMETGVRDARDLFDLKLCRRVCEIVFPHLKEE